jgi:hypothetical protein
MTEGAGPERRRPRHERPEEARHALGQLGIRRHGDQLVLPQVKVPLGEICEVRRLRHGGGV